VRQHKIYPQWPKIINKHNQENTIGFFGDSFCANSVSEHSWCLRLANKLDCGTITHWGVGGTSVWYMLLNFHKIILQNKLPKYIVILYTDKDRIYHPDVLLPASSADEKSETELEIATDMYRQHLDFQDKNEFQYRSSVQWFDQNTLKALQKQHKILQMFSFDKPEWGLYSGKIYDQALYPTYFENMQQGIDDKDLINHMTPKQNEDLAEKFSYLLD
tara:strand:- start:84 stop:734 length:651 start_codon:yes stop_codon:yes gene_type:complete